MNVLDITQLEALLQEAQFHKTSRTAENKRVRKYVMEQLVSRGFTKQEIAEKFGFSRKTVYNTLNAEL